MIDPQTEIIRLFDLMSASGRMKTQLISRPQQATVIQTSFPMPWARERPIYLNFDLWFRLSQPQRDLLLLRTVSWLLDVRWFKPDLYQGLALGGTIATVVELAQADAIGAVTAGGLTGVAIAQIWRLQKRSQREIEADEGALNVAARRGYSRREAARYLAEAIEAVARIEGRPQLSFDELIRTQNLRAIAGLSAVGLPRDGIAD
nr:DUF3318 domain-containing protein [Oxynema sp. CENA135]